MARISSNISSQLAQFLKEQPRFCVNQSGGYYILDGYFLVDLKDKGFIVDRCFEVRILVPVEFPAKLPSVFYDRRLIPFGFDHINSNGSLCLSTTKSQEDFLTVNPSLLAFFNLFLKNYLFSVEYFRKYSVFPFGKWSHGQKGEREYLQSRKNFLKEVKTHVN